jgi:2,3-bisphosphoglycerate-independent phosphoglycerate mutase
MDRDERWDRVYQAFHAIVRDKVLGDEAPVAETPYDAVNRSYLDGITDEFLVPTRIGGYRGLVGEFMADFAAPNPVWEWTGEECGFVFNFRGDRARQLTAMLTREGLPDYVSDDLLMDRDKPVRAFREHCLATMTNYGAALPVPVAFDKQHVADSLGEVLAKAGLEQLRCSESEKFPHVTHFFSGGREERFEGESRIVVPSPKLVETYDEKPEMSAAKLTAAVTTAIVGGKVDVIVVNFANPDMVGHTGKLDAAIAAVQAVDAALGTIAEAVRQAEGALIVTADHGNCERMKHDDGGPHTAHTESPVPFIYLNERDADARLRDGGSLADVAPTILDVLGLEQPAAMTGKTLRRSP